MRHLEFAMLKLQAAFFFQRMRPWTYKVLQVWGVRPHRPHQIILQRVDLEVLFGCENSKLRTPKSPQAPVNLSRKAFQRDLASYFWDTPIWILRVWNSRNYGIQTVLCAAFRNPNKSNASFESKFQVCQTLIWLMFHPHFVKVFRLVGGPLSSFFVSSRIFPWEKLPAHGQFF